MKEGIKILLVEDSMSDARLLELELSRNFDLIIKRVETEETYKSALTDTTPDIILSDYHLPGFTGMEALRIKNEIAPLTPFILVTGALNEETAVEVMKAGADDYIIKEHLNRLSQAIISAIEKGHERRARLEAEKELRKKEEYYRRITENYPNGTVTIYDKNLRLIFVAGQDMKKFNVKPEDFIGKHFSELSPDYTAEIAMPHLMAAFEGETRYYETPYWHDRYYYVTCTPLQDEDGTINHIMVVSQNVTETKQAEIKLIETEKKFREILENSSNMFYSQNTDNVLTYVSPQCKQILGYEPEEAMVNWTNFITDNPVNKKGIQLTQLALDTGQRQPPYELELKKKDGQIVWVEVREVPITKNGKTTAIVGSITDITEKRESAILLKESEEKYRKLIELSVDAVLIVEDGKITFANNAAAMLFNIKDVDDIKGKQIIEMFYEDHQNSVQKNMDLILRNKASVPRLEVKINRNDRKIVDVELVASSFTMKGLTAVQIILRDISQRKAQEATLRFQARLLNEIGEAIIATDMSGKITYWNRAAEKLYGWRSDEVIGKSIVEITPAETTKKESEEILNQLIQGNTWVGEIEVKRKDGTSFPAEVFDSPVINDKGELIGIVGISTDITDKKRSINELISAKEKAEEINRVKDAFFASMSHELRTPMIGILGYTDFLIDEVGDNRHQEMIRTIQKSAKRLNTTLNSILEISKLEGEKISLEMKNVNINHVIRESLDLFRPAAVLKNLSIEFHEPDDHITIVSDENILHKMMNNLINNAIKYTEIGGVEILLLKNSKKILIEVKDSGVGISKDALNIIFEPFRQESEGYSRRYEGTGLGLAIVKRYVERLRGHIAVSSSPGKGSIFRIELPLKLT